MPTRHGALPLSCNWRDVGDAAERIPTRRSKRGCPPLAPLFNFPPFGFRTLRFGFFGSLPLLGLLGGSGGSTAPGLLLPRLRDPSTQSRRGRGQPNRQKKPLKPLTWASSAASCRARIERRERNPSPSRFARRGAYTPLLKQLPQKPLSPWWRLGQALALKVRSPIVRCRYRPRHDASSFSVGASAAN